MRAQKSKTIFVGLLLTSLLFTASYAYGSKPARQSNPATIYKKEVPNVNKRPEKSVQIPKATKKVSKITHKAAEVKPAKVKPAKAQHVKKSKPKEAIKENKERGKTASELKKGNQLKENHGRINAIKIISEMINNSVKKIVDGLKNALDSIDHWLGIPKLGIQPEKPE